MPREAAKWRIRMKKRRNFKDVKGSATIEMAYIAPMTIFIIASIITIVFYFFDKNIMIGAAAETATIAAQLERQEDFSGEIAIEEIFRERVEGKLILFNQYEVWVNQSSKRITVDVRASKGPSEISVSQSAEIMKPEKEIRRRMELL